MAAERHRASGEKSLATKLAVVVTHPIQYLAPWFRRLTAHLDLHVFYAHRATAQDQAAGGFGIPFEWDLPLLEGYPFTWLENRARRPGLDHFKGCDTPNVKEELRRGGFDAVLVNGWNFLCYWQTIRAARRYSIPVIVRGDSHLLTLRSRWKRGAKRAVYPFLLKFFDLFLSSGERNAEYLRSYGVSREKIFRAPSFVDNEFFRQTAERVRQGPGETRRRFGIPRGKTVFLFAGKLIRRKRPLDFLRALDALQRKRGDSWGLVVGEGPLRPLLENHIRSHGTPCTLAGFLNQREMGLAYAVADGLVLPSEEETWGLVVNEAMACGVPAVLSDRVGCAPDLIVEGQTGFTYPCGEVGPLARRLSLLAENQEMRRALGRRAAAHVNGFSIEAGCRGLLRALEVLPNRGER